MQASHKNTFDARIKNCWQSITRMYNAQAAQYDLTTNMGFVLINIDKEQGTTASQLAPLLGTEITSLTRILNAIENKKYIVRKTDTRDKRITRIYLTERGKQKREIAKREIKKFNEEVHQLIGSDKMETLFDTLDKIQELVLEKEKRIKQHIPG